MPSATSAQRRAAVLQSFVTLSQQNSRPPTIAEIADTLSIGKSTCHYHVSCLIRDGVLGRLHGSRGLFVARRETIA